MCNKNLSEAESAQRGLVLGRTNKIDHALSFSDVLQNNAQFIVHREKTCLYAWCVVAMHTLPKSLDLDHHFLYIC